MSRRTAVRAEPSTPKKPSILTTTVDNFIQKLNEDYNLGIEICDKSLTPSHRRERARLDKQFARFDKISNILHYLCSQRGEIILTTAGEAFHREYRAVCQKWIYKPKADADTLPSSSEPYKATSPGEQNELQEVLVHILQHLRQTVAPHPLKLPRSSTTVAAATAATTTTSLTTGLADPHTEGFAIPSRPSRSRSKRPSNEGLESPSKRVKELEPNRITTALDKVPARAKVGRDDGQIFSRHPDLQGVSANKSFNRSFYEAASANTSKVSLVPSIFSNQDLEPQASQSTVDPSPREPKKGTAHDVPASSTTDFFVPSSGDIRALDESSSRLTEQTEEIEPSVLQRYGELASSPGQSTEYSDFSALLDFHVSDARTVEADPFEARLAGIWPKLPSWHQHAPLAVLWEFTRVCLHCGVDVEDVDISYEVSWSNEKTYRTLWLSLLRHPALVGKAFPEPPDENAWAAAMKTMHSADNKVVVFTASIDFNPSRDGPLFLLHMNPIRMEKGCRINRRFGPDRFLEVLMPSTSTKDSRGVRVLQDAAAVDKLVYWLTRKRHSLFGRQWAAFFVADSGYRKPIKELRTSPDAKPIFKERVHMFAEHTSSVCADVLDAGRVEMMLDWLLQFKANQDQSYLKLFSRIQLGLSKTDPVIVLEEHQIRHCSEDIMSRTRKVMNDGIARVSVSIARIAQQKLGLSDLPSAIQGRMGSAKGMWIVDVQDNSNSTDHWIETYPSQRKWNCDQSDPFHRTLEVHGVSHELRSASLNLQFLPVLEDRAVDKQKMRDTIGGLMADDLHQEIAGLATAILRPLEFKLWVQSLGSSRGERVQHEQVPFLAGLPRRMEDEMSFLVDGGFNPLDNKYLQDLAFATQRQKCDILKAKLNIRVGCSAYIYMVVDFWGILEENEVHVGFSTKFQDRRGKFSDVLLDNVDVLVARSPAHLISDVQKVRAVFKTELRALKDVIVFSAKGNTPLADKLSGGDYDGDKAWVCWDPDLVSNFVNAEVPNPPDLSAFLAKDKTTFGDLVRQGQHGHDVLNAVGDMLERSFKFNMGQSLLGQCTNYKEKYCYWRRTVRDYPSLVLSTLLSSLVDQSKQGIVFGTDAWDRLRKHLKIDRQFDDPAYKSENWAGRGDPSDHIVDHLKFNVVKKTVDVELEELYKVLNPLSIKQPTYDEDLVKRSDDFIDMAKGSTSTKYIIECLKTDLGVVFSLWSDLMSKGKDKDRDKDGKESTYPLRVTEVHNAWRAIEPRLGRLTRSQEPASKVVRILTERYLARDADGPSHETSPWSLLKASMTFKMYYAKNYKFVWQIVGRQLQHIKAMASSAKSGPPVLVDPLVYAGSTVDKKFVTQWAAMKDGQDSGYLLEDDVESEEEDDA